MWEANLVLYYVDICFDMGKCEFIVKSSNLKMLVVLSPIFVADTKITFVNNFVAPLDLHLYFLKNEHGIWTCVVSNFHPELEKMSIIWEIWNFHCGLKFYLGLAKPSWNFNSLYRAEFFTSYWNVILMRSLPFNRDEISTRLTSWISTYNQPLTNDISRQSLWYFINIYQTH